MISHCRYVNYETSFFFKYNMDNRKELKDEDERIAKQIAKISDSVHKKYHALKIDKIEEDIVLKKHFKPIVECRRHCW